MNEVYMITNHVNGKRYIGITCRGYQERYKEHLAQALGEHLDTRSVHYGIKKYGAENFSVICLESNIPDELAAEKEMYYIELYHTYYEFGIGYNLTIGGGGVVGYKHSEETKARIGNSLKGHVFPPERNEKVRQAMIGREYTPEWRARLSQARMGRFKGEENPFFGKHHTDETKAKIAKNNTKNTVYRLDDTNHILQIYQGFPAAGRWVVENGLSNSQPQTCHTRIWYICEYKPIINTAYGFRWRYEKGQSTNRRVGDELPLEAQKAPREMRP